MPRNVIVVVGNVNGSEYPSGGRVFALESEADAFIEEMKALPGYVEHRVSTGGAAPASVYVVTGDVGGSEYPSGGEMFGDEAAARRFAASLEPLDGFRGWKLEHGTDGGFQAVDSHVVDPAAAPVPRVNVAAGEAQSPEALFTQSSKAKVFEPVAE